METKDTLTLYEELVASGVSDTQAKIQAHQLGSLGDKVELAYNRLEKSMDEVKKEVKDMNKDMVWMRVIGAAMTFAFFSNIVMHKM